MSSFCSKTPIGDDTADNEDDDEEIKDKEDGDALLRDLKYQLKCQYMEKGRNLRVPKD